MLSVWPPAGGSVFLNSRVVESCPELAAAAGRVKAQAISTAGPYFPNGSPERKKLIALSPEHPAESAAFPGTSPEVGSGDARWTDFRPPGGAGPRWRCPTP